MAGDDDKISYHVDLDSKEALESILKLKGSIESLGESGSVEGLLEGLLRVAPAAGLVGAALFALHETMEIVFDAENIKTYNAQFEQLTANAGLSGQALRESLVKASGGLVEEIDLIKSANRALIEMGGEASHLGEIMEMAKKATAAGFGGSILENFDNLNKSIAFGNERMLRQLGIRIDLKKALKDYADAQGIAVDTLNREGKGQAILSAALEKSKTAYGQVGDSLKEGQNTWQRVKVDLAEVKEAVVLLFDKTLGPLVRSSLTGIEDFAKRAKASFTDAFGTGSNQATAHVEVIQNKLKDLKSDLADLQSKKGVTPKIMDVLGLNAPAIEAIQNQIKQYEKELGTATEKVEELESAEKKRAGSAKTKNNNIQDKSVVEQEEAKHQAKLAQMEIQRIDSQMQVEKDFSTFKDLQHQREIEITRTFDAQLAEIAASHSLNDKQKAAEEVALRKDFEAKKVALAEKSLDEENKFWDYYQKHASGAIDAVGKSFVANSKKMELENRNFQKTGQAVYDAFSSHASTALEELGASAAQSFMGQADQAKSAADIFRDFMIGAIADVAFALGSQFVAKGVADLAASYGADPKGYAESAAGGSLIVLSGALKAMTSKAKAGGSSSGASGGGGGGGSYSESSFERKTKKQESESLSPPDLRPDTTSLAQETAQPKKAVTINIQGHMFGTDETRRWLTEQIRAESDATSFNIQSVGGGF